MINGESMSGSKPLPDVYAEGMEARVDGLTVLDCPYAERTNERQSWIEGWHERDGLDEDEPPEDEP